MTLLILKNTTNGRKTAMKNNLLQEKTYIKI